MLARATPIEWLHCINLQITICDPFEYNNDVEHLKMLIYRRVFRKLSIQKQRDWIVVPCILQKEKFS